MVGMILIVIVVVSFLIFLVILEILANKNKRKRDEKFDATVKELHELLIIKAIWKKLKKLNN